MIGTVGDKWEWDFFGMTDDSIALDVDQRRSSFWMFAIVMFDKRTSLSERGM